MSAFFMDKRKKRMNIAKTLFAAAALSSFAAAATAGGLSPVAVETAPMAPVVVETVPPAGGSINSGYVVLGLLAALVAASGSF